ncbi:MAG: thioredoxin [Clostridia bacterium]|nr:thioredoxin [Clostridia bacterium]
MVIALTKDNFENEVLNCDKKILIDFYAVWCGPCKMVSPLIDQIAEENPDIKVCKVNVDEEEELASKFGVMSIPSIFVVKNKEIIAEKVGFAPKTELEAMIK